MSAECLIDDHDEKIHREVENTFNVIDEIHRLVEDADSELALTPELILRFHGIFREGIYPCAGTFRTWGVRITGSNRRPPSSSYVPDLVDQMCETIAENPDWDEIELATYIT